MRLLNTTTFQLKEFLGVATPEYAILSHTWGEEEIIFQDLLAQAGAGNVSWKTKNSFEKVSGFCSLAHDNGYQWCWIDTCCIDKTSSAELSEAINSMFRWYAESHVCFAYLADITVDYSNPEKLGEFEDSRWHTRGWTLQELLAPERVEFYDVEWNRIGTRLSLRERISKITGIRTEILGTKFEVEASRNNYCVAEKLSWAASRKTTRVEDLAYCLLGIFDVNMPLLYGEGERAFERLQFQILTETEDLTLFAWKNIVNLDPNDWLQLDGRFNALLALSPLVFSQSKIEPEIFPYHALQPGSYSGVLEGLEGNGASIGKFIVEQPLKRLRTVVLSVALFRAQENRLSQDYMILSKLRRSDDSKRPAYLCLPLSWEEGSKSYVKRGEPSVFRQHERRQLVAEVHRITVQLEPKDNVLNPMVFPRSLAGVLTLQGAQSPSRRFFAHHKAAAISALLLRYESKEILLLFGENYAENRHDNRKCWIVTRTWEELLDKRSLLHTELSNEVPSDFSEHRFENGTFMQCRIKPRVRDWFLLRESQVEDAQIIKAILGRGRTLVAVDIVVRSPQGQLEEVQIVGWKQFESAATFQNWVEDSSLKLRLVLLAEFS